MTDEKQTAVLLAPFTTFHIGGPARVLIEAHTDTEVEGAIAYAREHNLPLFPLGAGSNILVPDTGVEGVVLKITSDDIAFQIKENETFLIAGAGVLWEKIINAASERNLFGIENLAGIPGTMGGASVQNIGAYGAEFADVFEYADVIDSTTGVHKRVTRTEASFAYRTSFFKKHRELVVLRVALHLSKQGIPNITYPDLARASENGTPLKTPSEIARAIRAIRSEKFPRAADEGTAGSFFKNPIIPRSLADSLARNFPGLPAFLQEDGEVKVPLAWLLDHALSLKGYSKGLVRLYEKQPIVIVTRAGATATDVDAFARDIADRVFAATGIAIEREVETFGAR